MTMQITQSSLILASASPRRVELLKRIVDSFQTIPSRIDESEVLAPLLGREPGMLAETLALAKAYDVAKNISDGVVLGADTLVVIDGTVLGKPQDADDAVRILRRLSASTHHVITGVAVLRVERGKVATIVNRHAFTTVTMRPMSDEDIHAYVASGEPFGKAGAYAIQEHGDRFVECIDGPFDNVVGLPLETVRLLLHELRVEIS
jgi:septum formation protein